MDAPRQHEGIVRHAHVLTLAIGNLVSHAHVLTLAVGHFIDAAHQVPLETLEHRRD